MRIFNFLKSNNDKHKSIRIKTNIGDKFVSVNLDQTYESMDILSLKVYQNDVYRLFDADYGIIVGRVLANGVGIPNCRISVFVPINEETITNPTNLDDIKKIEAAALYPFKTVLDKDGNGKVYNLLPKYSRNRNFNGFPDNDYGIGATPKAPVGSFSEKEEVVTNETVAYVYDKYYKFSTITNESGDYILTVPSNRSYTVNMCCDITDIGRFSTTAALLKLDGLPDSFFTPDGLRINENIPLERLPNIDIQNQGITVKPLWTQNTNNTNVGINRLDFQLTKKIQPFITIVGNQFTQNARSWWGDKVQFRLAIGIRALCFNVGAVKIKINGILPFIVGKAFLRKMCTLNGGKGDYEPFEIRLIYQTYDKCTLAEALAFITDGLSDDILLSSHVKGNLDIKLFSVKNTVPETDADILNSTTFNNDTIFTNYPHKSNIELYDTNKYVTYQYNGNFIVLVNCNRNKVITNENGDLIPVDNSSAKGVYTSFRGYFYLTNQSEVDNPPTRYRVGKVRLKVPQFFDYGDPTNPNDNTKRWIWKHFKFDFGKIYSVAQQTMVRFANMSPDNEAYNDYSLFENGTEGPPPFDQAPKAYANQTNLLLIGENEPEPPLQPLFDEDNITITPNDNIRFPNYINSYNHILYLGDDSADNEPPEDAEVKTETEQNPTVDPPVEPVNNNTYKITMRRGGSMYFENTSADNTTPTFFNENGLIFDSIIFTMDTIDDASLLPSNLVFNYKVQKYNFISGGFDDLFDFKSSNDLLDENDNPIGPIPLDDVSNSFYSLNYFRINYDLISGVGGTQTKCKLVFTSNINILPEKYIEFYTEPE
jgi:hypothetical protein